MSIKCSKCHFDNPDKTVFCGKCAASLPAPGDRGSSTETVRTVVLKELATGSTFAGRYQVIEELGRGGMGRVYKVFDERIKEKVALKLLKPEISADEASIERFSNELRFARKIAHRHVCRMFDLGEDDGARYITMEYVPGEDLKSVLRMMGQMSAGKAVLVARQVCEGLAEAHRLGVVHRDLKPQNIMIDREGNVRIMDFGIARSLKVKGMTGAGVVIGTPEYMSPEQIEGQEVDGRSDVYSLGIILYEMMTGRVPFEGETFLSIALKQKTEPPRNPREINPQVPDDLVRLILRCLDKDKAKRFQGAQDLLSDLGKIEKGIPTTEKVLPSVKPSTSREITVKLNPRKLVIPAAALAVLVVAAIFALRLLPRKSVPAASTGKPSLAVMRFENNTGDAGLDHWRKALPELLITDLSQSKYVNVLASDQLFDVLSQLNQIEAGSYSSKTLKEVAVQGGVNHILLGQLTKAGDSFRLSYMLKAFGTGETVGSGWVAGQGIESFYAMADGLTRKVKEDLKLTRTEISGDVDAELGKITTASPEAFLLYVEGREAHHKADNVRSIELMRKAVAIDPGFAMAYRSMAMSYQNSQMNAESKKWLEKAMTLSDRVSEKERYLLQGNYYSLSERTISKAIESYQNLLKIYPDDSFAHISLAYLYLGYEMWDKAIDHCLAAVRNKDRIYYAYSYLSTAYFALGRPEKAREVIDGYFRDIGESSQLHVDLSGYYLYQGKFSEALEEMDKAIALSPATASNYIYKADLFLFQGDLARTEEECRKLLTFSDPTARGYYLYGAIAMAILRGKFNEARTLAGQAVQALENLNEEETANAFRNLSAYSLWRSGHPREAIREYDKILEIAEKIDSLFWKISALHRKGLALISQNSFDEAGRAAEALSAAVRQGMNPNEIRRVDHLQGAIELRRGNTKAAIDLLKKAFGRLFSERGSLTDSQALFLEPLAEAYLKSGDLGKAREEYEKITALTEGRHMFGDIYARSFYQLGKIAEQEGDKTKAREYYRKFLDLWKDADPGLPEVADARKRLAGL
jgi:serine/threonine protein kinase/tetratricopeptide (TPR) repeat protein